MYSEATIKVKISVSAMTEMLHWTDSLTDNNYKL